MGSRKFDKYGKINYYNDSQVRCMGPVYCENKKLSDSGHFFYLGRGAKKTGTKAIRGSHDNMAQYC